MRQIDTTRFGMIDIDEQKIINFPMGIPGFEEDREFVMIPYEAPFVFLQSVTSSDLAFMMINPFDFFKDYEIPIDDEDLNQLQIYAKEDLVTFSLLTVRDNDVKKTTANLLAPIIINKKTHAAKQLILKNTQYTTHHELVQTQAS